MAKGCLTKLTGNVTVGCTIPLVGIKNIYLVHTDDVVFRVGGIDNSTVVTAEMAPRAVTILVEGYKQNIQMTSAVRAMDVSAKLDIAVMFKMSMTDISADLRVRSLLTGKFYVLVERNDGANLIVGYTSPLECSGVDWDSNANAGLATVTLSASEGSAGNYFMRAASAAVASIKSKVGA
jgi:hypothetical protein|nr:MAG TPA: hypothetical protein [Caudoviricetes sp.]